MGLVLGGDDVNFIRSISGDVLSSLDSEDDNNFYIETSSGSLTLVVILSYHGVSD